MSIVVVIGAPSGAGKTTLLRRLIEEEPTLRFSVSHTTRAPRDTEVDGVDYHFVDVDTFAREVAGGGFLEWAEVYGNRYGTHRDEVERARREGFNVLLDVDVQGARAIRGAVPKAAFILIVPPSWAELERRLRARATDSEEVIQHRLQLARSQVEASEVYDYVVVNDDFDQARGAIAAILRAERHRREIQRPAIERLLTTGQV